jgi:hypothetical protein
LFLWPTEIDQGANMAFRQQQELEWPDGPPGTDDQESVVLPHDALLPAEFQLDIVG